MRDTPAPSEDVLFVDGVEPQAEGGAEGGAGVSGGGTVAGFDVEVTAWSPACCTAGCQPALRKRADSWACGADIVVAAPSLDREAA